MVPVPAATKPPMVVIHWGPAVGSRTQVNVDVDEERDGNREVMNEQDQTERIEAAKLKLNTSKK